MEKTELKSKKVTGNVEAAKAQNGGTKGHSKPGSGNTHAGPPPAPRPQLPKTN